MDLTCDVKLLLCHRDLEQAEAHISINDGTRLVDMPDECYYMDSYVPKDKWRSPTKLELSTLFDCDVPKARGKWIKKWRVPDPIFHRFRDLALAESSDELAFLEEEPDICEAKYALQDYLESVFSAKIGFFGIGINKPGLRTVTRDEKFHGLHIDSCSKEPLDKRSSSNNRFLMNLGLEPRYFLFMNIAVARMYGVLTDCGMLEGNEVQPGVTQISKLFMSGFPEYPVVRIGLYPGEAYIAPTENIIHDGSTIDSTKCDIYLTTRSRFDI